MNMKGIGEELGTSLGRSRRARPPAVPRMSTWRSGAAVVLTMVAETVRRCPSSAEV